MNYYERHLGDYYKNAAHLSLLEHGVYVRLMDVYYTREAPIPDDMAARLIGAGNAPETPETLQALQVVLQEFFELRDGHWVNERCDEEIAVYLAGKPERAAKKANEDNRLKRHRDERAELFKIITDAGQHTNWNTGITELRALAKTVLTGKKEPAPATAPATQPATAPATPATATHTHYPLPIPNINTNTEPNGSVASNLATLLPACQTQQVIDLYHEVLPELPRARLLSEKRKKAISGFWRWVLTSKKLDGSRRAQTAAEAMGWIRGYFGRARDNDFLMGRGPRSADHPGWQCDIDFLLTEKGMKQVIEKTREVA